jgi:hypothetical protein
MRTNIVVSDMVRALSLKLFSRDVLQTVDNKTIHEQGILGWDGNLMVVYSYVD